MKGVQRVLFRLPELTKAIADGRPIYIAEGEKDVLALVKHGFAATCNPGGAGKWLLEYSEALRGADVVVVPDDDGPGHKHANLITWQLRQKAKSVRQLPPLVVDGNRVKDAADYFEAGGQAADLDALAQDTVPMEKLSTGIASEYLPDESEAQPASEPGWADLVEDGAVLATKELPPIVEIVRGLISEQSKFVVGSGSKTFKTWLSMDLALSVAHGVPVLGRETERRRALYVNLELKPDSFARRLQAIASAKGITVEPAWFYHLPLRGKLAGTVLHTTISNIIKLVGDHRVQFVCLDPLYKLNSGDENSSRDQTLFFNELDRLTTEGGCTVLLNDHFSKGNQAEKQDPLDAIRGSSAKAGDVDGALVLRRHETEGCFSADVILRDLPPIQPFVVGWNFPLMELRTDLDPDKMKKAAGRKKDFAADALLALLGDSSLSSGDWMAAAKEELGMGERTFYSLAGELKRAGKAVKSIQSKRWQRVLK
jgi:hypothetical protein